MITPCVGICRLNERRECIGCRRTLAEIASWRSLTDAEREAILRRVRSDINANPEPERCEALPIR